MKKISFLITYLVILTISFSCKNKKVIENIKTEKESEITFKIDERTEFFRTIFNIASQNDLPKDIRPCQTDYLKRVNKHFLQFKNHPLIKWVYDNENIGIDFSTIGLMYKDLESFEFDTIYLKELKGYGLDKKILDYIQPLLIDFYKKSKFKDFFKSNRNYYHKAISKIEKQVSKEKLFNKVMNFYQENQTGLELIVFVELTNNANNKAIVFFDNYNEKKRAIILGNYCDIYTKPNSSNEIIELDNYVKGILYHETSHLFTSKLLKKHIGNLDNYKSICKDCNDVQITDKIDHMIVFPLQAIMMQQFDHNNNGHNFYINKCTDVRQKIYNRLTEYKPNDKMSFEKTYIDCINLIKQSALKQ